MFIVQSIARKLVSLKNNWFGLFEKFSFDFMAIRSLEYCAVNVCV